VPQTVPVRAAAVNDLGNEFKAVGGSLWGNEKECVNVAAPARRARRTGAAPAPVALSAPARRGPRLPVAGPGKSVKIGVDSGSAPHYIRRSRRDVVRSSGQAPGAFFARSTTSGRRKLAL